MPKFVQIIVFLSIISLLFIGAFGIFPEIRAYFFGQKILATITQVLENIEMVRVKGNMTKTSETIRTITIEYELNGKKYSKSRRVYWISGLKIGDQIDVYISENSPENILIEPKIILLGFGIFIALIILVGAIVVSPGKAKI